jgi:hypothetical protein
MAPITFPSPIVGKVVHVLVAASTDSHAWGSLGLFSLFNLSLHEGMSFQPQTPEKKEEIALGPLWKMQRESEP